MGADKKWKGLKQKRGSRPYCFLSYSSHEGHINTLIPCIWIAFSEIYDLRLTPSALESGAGQREQINKLIAGADFAIVAIDGLRPNVAHEFGMLQALDKPIILLKEKTAKVDIPSLLSGAANLAVESPLLNFDTHFSNVKDVGYIEWERGDPSGLVSVLLSEYRKKKHIIPGYKDITAPKLWHT